MLFLFTLDGSAQQAEYYSNDFDAVTDIISDEYEAGPWLIYDCQKKNWVCVMEEFYKKCEEKRKLELNDAALVNYSCSHVGKFPNKKACFQRQLFLTTHHHGVRFCIKDEWKQKAN
jgi:hypothetical protein